MSGGQGERESVFRLTSSRPPRFFEPKRPSIYRGVYWQYGKWGAAIKMGNKSKYLGSFDTEEEAARAYDAVAKAVQADPVLNFLPDGSLNSDRKKLVGKAASNLNPNRKKREKQWPRTDTTQLSAPLGPTTIDAWVREQGERPQKRARRGWKVSEEGQEDKGQTVGVTDGGEEEGVDITRAKIEGKSVDGMGKEQGGGPAFVLTGEIVEI